MAGAGQAKHRRREEARVRDVPPDDPGVGLVAVDVLGVEREMRRGGMTKSETESAPPTVSVVMTVYNTERYVREAVESILGQTFRDFEFIIIDDGSTDSAPAILREYADRDPRIRLVSRPNTGIVRAANEGIALARGNYLARMDSDDVALPHRFEKQVRYLNEHPACVLVGA